MTLDVGSTRDDYVGDGVNRNFNFTAKTLHEDDIHVVEGATDLTIRDDFDVVLSLDQEGQPGGQVQFTGPPPAAGVKGVIFRSVEPKQTMSYPEYGKFPAKSHESALDYLAMVLQQNDEMISRSVRTNPVDNVTDIIFPNPNGTDYIRWDGNGGLTNDSGPTVSGMSVAGLLNLIYPIGLPLSARGDFDPNAAFPGTVWDKIGNRWVRSA